MKGFPTAFALLIALTLSVSFASKSQGDSCRFSLEECRDISLRLNDCKSTKEAYTLLEISYNLSKIEIDVRKAMYEDLAALIRESNKSRRAWRKARLEIANKVK